MEKKITPALLQTLRSELNEAVKEVASRHGVEIRFGNAKYEDLSATYQVSVAFAATDSFDPAKALWDTNCKRIGLEPEDFGKEFSFPREGTTYMICGYNPKGRTNTVLIRNTHTGKEYTTSPGDIKHCLGRTRAQQVAQPSTQCAPTGSEAEAERKAKRDWDLHCWRTGLKTEDFGKTVTLSGKLYKICGVKPSARTNTVLIRDLRSGKEYVTSPEAIREAWKQTV